MIERRRAALPPKTLRSIWSMAGTAVVAAALGWSSGAMAQQQGQPGSQPEPASAPEQGFDAYVSQEALQVLYTRNMDIGELGQNDVRAGFFLSEDRDLIGIADILVDVGEPERRPWWALEVGPRVYGALLSLDNQDIFSIAFGGKLSYFIGRSRSTAVSLSAFYAPDILTFGNADNITDIIVQIETEITENTRVLAGYRTFEFDLGLPIDREVDDGMHIGIRHRF